EGHERDQSPAWHRPHFHRRRRMLGIKQRAKTLAKPHPSLTSDPVRPDADVSQHASVTSRATISRWSAIREPKAAKSFRAAGDRATRSAIEETRRSGSTIQTRTAIRLANDRVADTAMVAPLVATDTVSGVLIALRVGRSFAAAYALTASGVSALLSLDLARET